jgi:REP element-mobilizing transposase RayT
MPRPPRLQVAGATYHITSRGNRQQSIYHDDYDRLQFLGLRNRVLRRHGWRTQAYCLMTNHFHLLIATPEPNLAAGMHQLNGGYAKYFNERHSTDGHLFERRYDSRVVDSEDYLTEVLEYIAFNPVNAGLCAHPWEWRWSSFYGQAQRIAFGW